MKVKERKHGRMEYREIKKSAPSNEELNVENIVVQGEPSKEGDTMIVSEEEVVHHA